MIKTAPANRAYNAETLMRVYPSSLRVYDNMVNLGETAFRSFEKYYSDIEQVLIYPAIDNMPEEVLDILAKDLKVDWYDYDYSVESKRELIKTSVYVHKFLGTPAAVERMLSSVFPGSEIEEWFDYGGEPHHFRIVIGMQAAKETADITRILRAVNMVKRLSSWLDGVYYRVNVNLVIQSRTRHYRYSPETDRDTNLDGTHPWRATKWQGVDSDLVVETQRQKHAHPNELEGTTPWRAQLGRVPESDVTLETEPTQYRHRSGTYREDELDGTQPWRAEKYAGKQSDLTLETHREHSGHNSPMDADSAVTGTDPWRAQTYRETQRTVALGTEADPYVTPAEPDGTTPWRAETLKDTGTDLTAQTHVDKAGHRDGADAESAVTGTEPWRAEQYQATERNVVMGSQTERSVIAAEPDGTEPWRAQTERESASDIVAQTDTDHAKYKTSADGKPIEPHDSGSEPPGMLDISAEAEAYRYRIEYDTDGKFDT